MAEHKSNMTTKEITQTKHAMEIVAGKSAARSLAGMFSDVMHMHDQVTKMVQPIVKTESLLAELRGPAILAQRIAETNRTIDSFRKPILQCIEASDQIAKVYRSTLPLISGDYLAKAIASMTIPSRLFEHSLIDLRSLHSTLSVGVDTMVKMSVISATLTKPETAAIKSATDSRFSHGNIVYRRSGILTLSAEVQGLKEENREMREQIDDLTRLIKSDEAPSLPARVKDIRLNEQSAQLEVGGQTIQLTRDVREYRLCQCLFGKNGGIDKRLHIEEIIEAGGERLDAIDVKRENEGFRQAARRINDKIAKVTGRSEKVIIASRQYYSVNSAALGLT